MPKSHSKQAEDFFYEWAGWGYDPKKETADQGRRRGAKLLAKAERIASDLGWKTEWEEDQEPWEGEGDPPNEVLNAVLYDENYEVVGSLSSIGMSGNQAEDRRYGRVVEAELALEAASEKGLL